MNSKIKLLLAACAITFAVQIFSADTQEPEIKGRKKCLKGHSLNICNNAFVGGNITGGSFSVLPAPSAGTPGVAGIGGALGWATFYNNSPVSFLTGATYPFSTVVNSVGGINLNTSNGQITIGQSGVYQIAWTLQFSISITSSCGGLISLLVNDTLFEASLMDVKAAKFNNRRANVAFFK